MMPLPRRVKFRVKGLFDWLPLSIIFAAVIIAMVSWESACRVISYKFGHSSTAVVDSVITWDTHHHKHGTTHHYRVKILYPAPEFKYASGLVKVPFGYYSTVKKGDEVPIYFYEKFPKYPMFEGGFDFDLFYLLSGLLVVGMVLVAWGIIRQRNFMVNGMPVIANIALENKGSRVRSSNWTITYNWEKGYFVKYVSSIGIGDTNVLLLIKPHKPDSYMVYQKYQLWDVDDWGRAL